MGGEDFIVRNYTEYGHGDFEQYNFGNRRFNFVTKESFLQIRNEVLRYLQLVQMDVCRVYDGNEAAFVGCYEDCIIGPHTEPVTLNVWRGICLKDMPSVVTASLRPVSYGSLAECEDRHKSLDIGGILTGNRTRILEALDVLGINIELNLDDWEFASYFINFLSGRFGFHQPNFVIGNIEKYVYSLATPFSIYDPDDQRMFTVLKFPGFDDESY